ncbi:MAG: hypothetical protein LR015_03550 [Verrucomicrobia bacterium]|nr:hypothetical protein [Verrucomicrobiota bacterium]
MTAGVAYGIGQLFAEGGRLAGALKDYVEEARALAHGLSGGALAEAQGGKFSAGFLAGFSSQYASHRFGNSSSQMGRIIRSSIIGGTASRLGGGRFESGAVTSAFQTLFNQFAHGVSERVAQSGEPSRSDYKLLNPGDEAALDGLLTNPDAVDGLGRLYLLNRAHGRSGNLVTEYAGTFYSTDPAYANELSNTTVNLPGRLDGSVQPQITRSRMDNVIGVAHTHWGDQLPTWPADFAYMRPEMSSRGWWSIVVTRQNIFFVGPSLDNITIFLYHHSLKQERHLAEP